MEPVTPFPPFQRTGFYDWCVKNDRQEIVSKGRFIVFPENTSRFQFYEVGALNPFHVGSGESRSHKALLRPIATVHAMSSPEHDSVPEGEGRFGCVDRLFDGSRGGNPRGVGGSGPVILAGTQP